MGTAVIDITNQGSTSNTRSETVPKGPSASMIGSPVSNAAYNVIAELHKKLEGLEAYCTYAHDGDAELWEELRRADLAMIYKLVAKLEQTMREKKLLVVPEGPH